MTTTTPVFLQQNDEESSAKRKDGSEERLIFSENVQAAYNDTSLDENGQESAISVVSKNTKNHVVNNHIRIVDHGQDEGYKGKRNSNVGGGYGGGSTEFENSEKEGHGWGGKKKRCIFQRLPSAAILLAALVVAVLGLSSFASAVPILAKELDTPGAAAMATSTAGDIIPVKQVASEYSSQPLLKQVGDMLATSKASLQALATGGGTTESSQEMDIAVVKLDVIAKSPRYTNDGGVEEFQEMSAIMTLLKNQLSDPDFISSLPEHLRNSMQMLQQEMANAERAMEQIEPIIGSSQIDSSSSSRTSTDRSSANTNAVKREYEQSIASKRRVLNEGGTTTDQHEQDANQEDSTFRQGEGSSSSFPFQPQTDARKQEKLHELLNGQGQGRHARARMNWQGDQSRRRLNEDNGYCASVENAASQTKQKNAQCARLADCAKDYSLYDLFVYMHGDDIDFATGTVDKRIRGFDEINMRLKLHRIKDLSADLLGPTPVYDECDKLLQQFHRFDEGLGTFDGIWQGGSVTSVCRGQGTSKFLSLQSIAQIMISLYKNAYPHEKPLDNSPGISGLSPGLLELCQGDCDDDSDCAEGLECFYRSDGRDVPGCTDTFLVEIFEEFVGCAGDIGKQLSIGDNFTSLFTDVNRLQNPFSSSLKLSLPDSYKEVEKDEHGKGNMAFLDTSFKFLDFNASNFDGGELLVVDNKTTTFTKELKTNLVASIAINEFFEDIVENNGKDLSFLDDTGGVFVVKSYFSDIDEIQEVLKGGELKGKFWIKNGDDEYIWKTKPTLAEPQRRFTRSFLDASIAAIFGEKTSIGQVCSYAQGLKDGNVTTVPGFCCLDAPYEADYWGELYSCTHRSGSKKGEAKSKGECNKLAPFTAGFSEAACDSLSGTWCPNPRPCFKLNNCMRDMLKYNSQLADRQAFYQYLDDAPKITYPNIPNECADVREYFEYDRNFPDDNRICKEVEELQCFDEFSNLDGYAKGTSNGVGEGDGEDQPLLFMSTKLVTNTEVGFETAAATAWRSTNYALSKVVEIAEFVNTAVKTTSLACEALPSDALTVAAKASCILTVVVVKSISDNLFFVAKLALSISERLYSEIVNPKNAAKVSAERNAIYENVITNHKNIQTTFKAVQQLKQMLGEVAEDINDLAEDINDLAEDGGGRRLAKLCGSDDACSKGNCKCADAMDPNKRDPAKDCNCNPNYDYIKKQKGAGCDEFDSDGDNIIDFCEDRHPPTLMFANAALFKCDEANLTKHCYTEKVFLKNEYAENFLKDQVIVTDDCLIAKGLDMVISREGTCSETVFSLFPRQNYTECKDIPTLSNEITAPSSSPSGASPNSN
eukprot:scaffold1372_cov289-Chaetoceros_neogracile.AAC.17